MATQINSLPKKNWSLTSLVLFSALAGVLVWIVLFLIRGVRHGWGGRRPADKTYGGNRWGVPGAPHARPTNTATGGGAVTGVPSTGFANLDEL
jgi:hypothetical protein